jgi:hypothetical protein
MDMQNITNFDYRKPSYDEDAKLKKVFEKERRKLEEELKRQAASNKQEGASNGKKEEQAAGETDPKDS